MDASRQRPRPSGLSRRERPWRREQRAEGADEVQHREGERDPPSCAGGLRTRTIVQTVATLRATPKSSNDQGWESTWACRGGRVAERGDSEGIGEDGLVKLYMSGALVSTILPSRVELSI